MRLSFILAIVFFLSLSACSDSGEKKKFTLLPSSKTGITFTNKIEETPDLNPIKYIYLYNGAGVGTGDINNDGLPDLFFAGNLVSSKLYLNMGDMTFQDITQDAGVSTSGWATGVSFIDINADGLIDIYVCMADKDGTKKGENLLYINKGDNTFEEKSKEYGLNDSGYSTQAAFLDYDKDGDLDMYLLTNGIDNHGHNNVRPIKSRGQGLSNDRLYQNNGDNTFTDVSKKAGISIEGYGLGIGIIDINGDKWPDIYCSNDFITNDLLWVNNRDGTFTESIAHYLTQTSYNGMGIDVADFNNDGKEDIVQMDMLPESNAHLKSMTMAMSYNNQNMRFRLGYFPQYVRNTMQMRSSDHSFSEIGRMAGIHKTDWSWAPLIADFDNDGYKDLFVSNGYGRDITDLDYTIYSNTANSPFGTKEGKEKKAIENMKNLPQINLPNYFFRNKGNLQFENATQNWTNEVPSMSNGAIYVDLDRDGDLDIVTNNVNEQAFVYKNHSVENNPSSTNFLNILLEGPRKNPSALGAEVSIYCEGSLQKIINYPIRGYVSSVDPLLHFGLGEYKKIDSIKVVWPDEKIQLINTIPANTTKTISYFNARPITNSTNKESPTIFSDISNKLSNVVHKENPYIDFQDQPLLLKMLSREGPGLAVGDVNQDGLDDFVLSTALKDTTYIWFQKIDGTFFKGQALPDSWLHENQGCILADFNNDGRLDLFMASGGNEFENGSEFYCDRLYLQSDEGVFKISPQLPKTTSSTSTVNACDFDNDGDLDLFVGSRLKPKHYPEPGQSYLLENNNGLFKDITAAKIPEIQSLGLITSALWTDFNNDNKTDLIVVGEWMEISFFENQGSIFKNVTQTTGVNGLYGFWNSITGADMDLDGDIDYIIGNLGTNTELKASKEEPITVVAKDFDLNGSIDPLISYYVQGVNYPLASRDALISQVNAMKRRFPFYKDYANATFNQVLTEDELKGAIKKQVTILESIYLENNGDGSFTYQTLPPKAQIAPIYGISVTDLNADPYPDLILIGNRRDSETLSGFLDGSLGLTLMGSKDGNFATIDNNKSGLNTKKEARGMVEINLEGKRAFLVANNNGPVQAYTVSRKSKSLQLQKGDLFALIELYDGTTFKKEFYLGSGYLSQSPFRLDFPENVKQITIFNTLKGKRILTY